jgi:L-threonylcarbamoyladenylate synthase
MPSYPPDSAVLAAVTALREGGLIALPTETVYGLGADAENELAVRRIFAVKGRPQSHPLIVHLSASASLSGWARDVPNEAQALARAFWPGPLTLILKRGPRALDVVTGGQDTVGLRVPAHLLAQAVLTELDGGIAAPSANRFGKVSPTTAEHVRHDLGAQVDVILDGGPCGVGVESTIVDVSRGEPRLLRPGGLAREAIESVLGKRLRLDDSGEVRAPGVLESHYAPSAGVILVSPTTLAAQLEQARLVFQRIAVLGPPGTSVPPGVALFETAAEVEGQARLLYQRLRDIDVAGHDVVLAVLPDEHGVGAAVRDRLKKAAAPRS